MQTGLNKLSNCGKPGNPSLIHKGQAIKFKEEETNWAITANLILKMDMISWIFLKAGRDTPTREIKRLQPVRKQ